MPTLDGVRLVARPAAAGVHPAVRPVVAGVRPAAHPVVVGVRPAVGMGTVEPGDVIVDGVPRAAVGVRLVVLRAAAGAHPAAVPDTIESSRHLATTVHRHHRLMVVRKQ